MLRISLFHFRDFAQIRFDGPVGDQLDVVEPHHALSIQIDQTNIAMSTFTIGSPNVFQTAPPQPASNARMTCSPQLVGGPDASQNGLGE